MITVQRGKTRELNKITNLRRVHQFSDLREITYLFLLYYYYGEADLRGRNVKRESIKFLLVKKKINILKEKKNGKKTYSSEIKCTLICSITCAI